MASGFHYADYIIFVLILVISTAIGFFHGYKSRHNNTSASILLGDRKMQWLPVGISTTVTFTSGITFIGIPAEIYLYGTSYFLFHIGQALSVVICCVLIVPLLFPLKLISVWEYFERRFKSRAARMVGSVLGMVNMLLYVGVVIFAPATAMEAASGVPVWASILMIGLIAIIYTSLGGMRAVIWTDVFQFLIMVAGLLAMLIQGTMSVGGPKKVWEISREGGRIDFSDFDVDPRTRHTVWSLVIGATFTWLSNIGINQSNVQRFSSVPTLSAARGCMLLTMPGFVIFGMVASFLGLIVYAHFSLVRCDPLEAGIVGNGNQIVPLFVSDVMDFLPGFLGLFIGALFCAALSTVSSTINGLAAMVWEDFIKKFSCTSIEKHPNIVLKVLVFIFGVIAMAVAFISMQLGGPATQIALSFFGASGGPLLGVFFLGCLFPCANSKGACLSAPIVTAFCIWLAIGGYSIPKTYLPPAPSDLCPQGIFNATEGAETNTSDE